MKQIHLKSLFPSLLITLAIAYASIPTRSFAYQYASFGSQATQGNQWFGTAIVKKEEFTITVYPDYLDVQVDWEIVVDGWNKPTAFTDALEIIGKVSLPPNSTVIGMLLWDGNKIYKAKLKTKDAARKAYEEVVDRNVIIPPRPKDPVLMEGRGADSYAISIFPASWGGHRKLRLRYLVPSLIGKLDFPNAFSANAKYTFINGNGLKGCNLTNSTGETIASVAQEPLILDPTVYQTYFRWDLPITGEIVSRITPILNDSSEGSWLYSGSFFGNGFAGQALNITYHIPKELMDFAAEFPESAPRIYATLSGENDSCRKEIDPVSSAAGLEGLKILAREAVGESLKWALYIDNELRKEILEKPRVIRMEDGMQYARSLGNSRVYPMAKQMPFSLGSALGFIDKTYSLLALEEDVLPAITADKYLLTGVPTLNPEDIFPAKEDTAISTNAWAASRGYAPEDLLKPKSLTAGRLTSLPQGMRYSLRDGRIFIRLDRALLDNEKGMGISIYSIKGKRAKAWGARDIAGGELSWSPSESGLSSGAYILKVSTKVGQYSQTVFLR